MNEEDLRKLDERYPLWWIHPPRTAKHFHLSGRIDITELEEGAIRRLCKGSVPEKHVGVVFYKLYSYTTTHNQQQTLLDSPGTITGRLAWWPEVNGNIAFSVTSMYPDKNGFLGEDSSYLERHDGFNESTLPSESFLPSLIVSSNSTYSIVLKILSLHTGDPIPPTEKRFIQAKIRGWAIFCFF